MGSKCRRVGLRGNYHKNSTTCCQIHMAITLSSQQEKSYGLVHLNTRYNILTKCHLVIYLHLMLKQHFHEPQQIVTSTKLPRFYLRHLNCVFYGNIYIYIHIYIYSPLMKSGGEIRMASVCRFVLDQQIPFSKIAQYACTTHRSLSCKVAVYIALLTESNGGFWSIAKIFWEPFWIKTILVCVYMRSLGSLGVYFVNFIAIGLTFIASEDSKTGIERIWEIKRQIKQVHGTI